MKLPNPIQVWDYYQEKFSYYVHMYDEYIDFIKQPLHPSQFIPWDMENNCPMEMPDMYNDWVEDEGITDSVDHIECMKYKKAEEKVLFEGFDEFDGWYKHWLLTGEFFMNGKPVQTIADLVELVDIKDSVAKQLNLL